MSFSLHSSTENFGGGRRSGSSGSNSKINLSWPEKSSMGLMSRNASASPLSRNHLNESRCTEIRSGSGRTSSRLAKLSRSRCAGRNGDKDYSLISRKGAVAGFPRSAHALSSEDARRQSTATEQYTARRPDAANQGRTPPCSTEQSKRPASPGQEAGTI